jgi:methyl-accepting chemotaxis protein WspA
VRRVTLWLLLGIVVPLTIAAIAVARSISRPVGFAARVAAQVATGDLTGRLETTRVDETGALLTALRAMIDSLTLLLGQVKRSSLQLTDTATRISTAARAQEANVADVSSSTHQITAAVRQISATGQELGRTMNDVSEKAAETAAVADLGQRSLKGMDDTMRQLAQASEAISDRLEVISEKAENISGVVLTITKVADQTNLLSLNAALEAAKAGQFGLGFAVVAREIRRLADQTAVGTLDIEQMVRAMQTAVA